ncbi:Uncharacterized protein YoxC, contains an MCP-like domain [Cohnella sp. OV330]|uniref:DUF948 domain-containing protein n=1 Tax=Cohnella sp. OV330 TaxID=1855288 RepID=UPI0008E4A3B7|nr:DUF948 domain-containing protein [Cohnella sp. OV330]SFB07150.1 Uncharacterized protein YoxC, contains an MCP-like domain [Cohnella sp. OV330]
MRGKSAALASVSLSVFVIYAVKTMKKTMATLEEANRTLVDVKSSALQATHEATALIHTVNRTVKDVKGRINTVDPLLETTHEVGDVLHTIAHSVKEALSPGDKEIAEKGAEARPPGIAIRIGDRPVREAVAGQPTLYHK